MALVVVERRRSRRRRVKKHGGGAAIVERERVGTELSSLGDCGRTSSM